MANESNRLKTEKAKRRRVARKIALALVVRVEA